jgi:hypothetical protein
MVAVVTLLSITAL